jgi:hypothetical protein
MVIIPNVQLFQRTPWNKIFNSFTGAMPHSAQRFQIVISQQILTAWTQIPIRVSRTQMTHVPRTVVNSFTGTTSPQGDRRQIAISRRTLAAWAQISAYVPTVQLTALPNSSEG